MSDGPSMSASGGDASWGAQPATGDWNTPANWDPATVPTDTATFGASSQPGITFAAGSSATVNAIAFAAGASAYTFTFAAPAPNAPALTIAGAGISNSSTNVQRFIVQSTAVSYEQPQLAFSGAATAGGPDVSYTAGPATPSSEGGGVIGFYDTSTAGSASFIVKTGGGTPPKQSTVGGEVSFNDSSSALTASFTIYGSTSTTDGDTFGNVVFHDSATAANALFANVGGTVTGGDGGNTQFFDNATAGTAVFNNMGGTFTGANGGDVAFDGTSSAAYGNFHNFAATASGAYGGVTSFNNNYPGVNPSTSGASAGSGVFYNYGAKASGQGGGHTSFSAVYGSPTAADGMFVNYGSNCASAVPGSASCAGHTIFSISLPQQASYCPSAGNATFINLPGTASGAPGGYTEFAVYTNHGASANDSTGPTAGSATFLNVGALIDGALGGQTVFSGTSSAANAQLIAVGGNNGGGGGRIEFYDAASGGSATVRLAANGVLDISDYGQASLTIGDLELVAGIIETSLGTDITCLVVSGTLYIPASPVAFSFESGNQFALNTPYTILTAANLSTFTADRFTGNSIGQASPTFTIVGNDLQVLFSQ